jgi:hypothetical protein
MDTLPAQVNRSLILYLYFSSQYTSISKQEEEDSTQTPHTTEDSSIDGPCSAFGAGKAEAAHNLHCKITRSGKEKFLSSKKMCLTCPKCPGANRRLFVFLLLP